MSKKDIYIEQLEQEIAFLENRIKELVVNPEPILEKRKYAGALSFDFWPLKDWFRFSIDKYNPGKYFQIAIGPFRLDFWQD